MIRIMMMTITIIIAIRMIIRIDVEYKEHREYMGNLWITWICLKKGVYPIELPLNRENMINQ